jgi:hypothetical protein
MHEKEFLIGRSDVSEHAMEVSIPTQDAYVCDIVSLYLLGARLRDAREGDNLLIGLGQDLELLGLIVVDGTIEFVPLHWEFAAIIGTIEFVLLH